LTRSSQAADLDKPRGTFELLEHTADTGVAVRSESLAGFFLAAAEGLRSVLTTARCSDGLSFDIELTRYDVEELLVAWLQEILYLFETKHFLPATFTIRDVSSCHLTATLNGTLFDPARHVLEHEIKAVTYHRLRVACVNGIWQADIYLDL